MPHRSTNWFSSVQWSFDERVEIADWIIDSMCSCATFYRRLFHVDWKKKLIESRTTRADWLSFGFPAELKLKTLLQTMSSLIPANLIQFSLWFHLLSLLNSLYCNILLLMKNLFIRSWKSSPKYARHFKFLFITLKGFSLAVRWKRHKTADREKNAWINLNNLFWFY